MQNLQFWPEGIKIGEVEKFVANFHDKEECVIHITNLKQALSHGLVLEKVHRVIKFNQKAWLKPFIDTNKELSKNAKNWFRKIFFNLVNNSVFRKTVENVRKHRNIKIVTAEKRRTDLVSEPNYHTTKFSTKILT